MSDQNAIDQQEWENPANWIGGVIYRSKRDSRLLVAKRAWGWGRLVQGGLSVNLGHRHGGWLLLGLFSVPLGFLLLFVLYQLSK